MTDMTMAFRRAGPDDIDAVVELAESAYRGEASRAGWTTEADFLDGQRIDRSGVLALLDGDQQILLARQGDRSVGCSHIVRDGDACWFGLFAVAPGLQGRGIGDALLERAEHIAMREFDATHMKMKVIWLRDSLIAWYERRGYSRTTETHAFPYGDDRFGRPRRDDLYFIVLHKALGA